MEDVLDAVGLHACEGGHSEFGGRSVFIADSATGTGDGSNQVDESGGEGWVTPKGWTTLY